MSNGNLLTVRAFFLVAFLIWSLGAQSREPEVRYQFDPARNRIWVLTGEGVFLHDVTGPERIAIRLPDWVSAGSKFACLPGLALGPKGEAVITSNVVPTLWTVHPETLAVTVHPLALDADTDKDVGFSALAYSPAHAAFFAVSDAHGSLWRIDPLFSRAQKIGLSEPVRSACGLAARPHIARQSMRRPARLCLHTPQQAWDIDFAPDQRSAYVTAREQPCDID